MSLRAQPPTVSSIANGASFSQVVSPGAIVAIFGSNLGETPEDISVVVGGRNAPALLVSPSQINVQFPFDLPVGPAAVTVTVKGKVALADVEVSRFAPAALTVDGSGAGPGVFTNARGLITNGSHATPGETVTAYVVGLGATNPTLDPGIPAPASPAAAAATLPTVTVGGADAPVEVARLSPGLVGVYEVSFVVPDVRSGDQKVIISIGGIQSLPVTLPVETRRWAVVLRDTNGTVRITDTTARARATLARPSGQQPPGLGAAATTVQLLHPDPGSVAALTRRFRNLSLRSLDAPGPVVGSANGGVSYTCDATINAVAGVCNILNTTIAGLYNAAFTNANANIYIRFGNTGLGQSLTPLTALSYSSFRSALIASGTSANDSTAVAGSVPATNPFGSDLVALTTANARALGFSATSGVQPGGGSCTLGNAGCYDGVITVSSSAHAGGQLYYRNGSIGPSQYDFYSVVQHETDEILGTLSFAFGLVNGNTTYFAPADLFRYHSNGTRSFAAGDNNSCGSSNTANACFSLNGVNMLQQYNNVDNGQDAGDWATNCAPPRVQDAVACPGVAGLNIAPNSEIIVLDVVGYNTAVVGGGVGPSGNSIWPISAVPGNPFHPDVAVTLGVKFRSDVSGTVGGIRFYKGSGNNGTHIGLLYSSGGALLAQATFTGETSSGWQQVNFSTPVAISANTTYIAAYFSTTGFAYDGGYFTNTGVDNAPLHALRSGVDGPNGVYSYGGAARFPASSSANANYWADVDFTPSQSNTPDLTITKTHSGNFTQGQTGVTYTITARNSGTSSTSGTVTVTETLPSGLTATSIGGTGWSCTQPAGPCTRSDALAASTNYPALTLTANVAGNAPGSVTNTVSVSGGGETNTGNNQATDPTTVLAAGGFSATSIWSVSTVPGNPFHPDSPATLGVKFRSDTSGYISGIRFYKGTGNNGTHIGLLYSSGGALLAQATFAGETTSGWQQMNFFTPVTISANTTYVAALFSTTGFAYDGSYFTNSGVDNAPLHALRSGVSGPNGVYAYGGAAQFPALSFGNANYWVDVVLASPSTGPDLTITKTHSGNFMQGQTGVTYTITARNSGTASTSGTVTVTETLPAGLTATSIAGTGWTCTQPAGPCTRTDALAAGIGYPALTLTVNVAGNAPGSVNNTVTVSGGGETNTGNDQATDLTTVLAVGGSATSIWSPSTIPGTPFHPDSAATLGVKFRSDTSGHISGIRFYKGTGNNGTHIGLLYTSSGTLLAQSTFTGETGSGWQQVNFSTPVAISANTTYIAALFSTTGFAYTGSYFTSTGADNAPLHALRSGVAGPNGVYVYGAAPQFPAFTFGDANYWVDVVLAP